MLILLWLVINVKSKWSAWWEMPCPQGHFKIILIGILFSAIFYSSHVSSSQQLVDMIHCLDWERAVWSSVMASVSMHSSFPCGVPLGTSMLLESNFPLLSSACAHPFYGKMVGEQVGIHPPFHKLTTCSDCTSFTWNEKAHSMCHDYL